MKRAQLATHHMWVTQFDPEELFPAGSMPNQHAGGGIADWVKADRSLENTNLVVWHTFGPTHVPRPEDWPVMPVDYYGFWLKPYGFLDRNPALDLPSGVKDDGSCCSTDVDLAAAASGDKGGCCGSSGCQCGHESGE